MAELKREFGKDNDKLAKVAKLKKVKQETRTIKEFIQEFRRVVRDGRYEELALVEELKREVNKVIRRKLMKAERAL